MRLTLLCSLVAVFVLAASACTPRLAPIPSPTPTHDVVRFGGLGGLIDRTIYVGQDQGFFAEQGLDVQVQSFQSAIEMVPLLATGQLDAGHGGSNAGLFNAMQSGVGIKLVSDESVLHAPGPDIHNGLWLVVRHGLTQDVQSVHDLKGRTIGVNALKTVAHEQLERALEYDGLTLEDVNVKPVAFSDMLAALANGAIDAAVMVEPFVTLAHERGIAEPLFDLANAMPGYTMASLFYGPAFIQNQPQVGKRFMLAYMKTLRYLEKAWTTGNHRDEAVKILASHTGLDPSLLDRMGVSYSEVNGGVNQQAIAADEGFFVQVGALKQPANPADIVDSRFADYALSVLGTYNAAD